jgi:hypothetical protein
MTTLLRRAGLTGVVLLAGGCASDTAHDGHRDDPLLGMGGRPANPPVATASAAGGVQGQPPPAYQPKPPLTATPTSNAALAGGGFQPLQGSSDLRMGAPADAQPPAFTDPKATAPVQPVAGVTPVPPPGAPAQPSAMVPAVGNSLDQAYAAVTAKAPLAYQMKFNSQTGEFTFQMKVPSRLNSAAVQSVEATAMTPTEAIQRALEQLAN